MKSSATFSMFLVFILGCAHLPDPPRDIVMGPYVNHVTGNGARISWVSEPGMTVSAELLLQGGTTGSLPGLELTTTVITNRPEVLHTAVLSGLEAGLSYDYEVICGGDRVRGRFHTAPPGNSRKPFSFAVYGDTRTHPERHRSVIDRMKRDLPLAFVLHTGDLIENGKNWEDWTRDFFTPARDLLPLTTLWPVRGNHEGDAVWYRALFDLPGNELYYSFDYGNLHVVILDCYANEDPEAWDRASPEMLRWLETDLAATAAEWIVVGYHVPTFNIGGHASTWGQRDVLPVLEKYGVDVVVNGHSHIYERFRPIGPPGAKPIIHIVSGGGGAPTYPVRPSPMLAAAESRMHHCLFTISGHRLEMIARSPDGEILDEMTLVKTDGTFQDSVLADAVNTADAMDGAFLASARWWADFTEVPQPGRFTPVAVAAIDRLPEGCRVRITAPTSSPWKIRPAEFAYTTNAPGRIMVQAPDGLVTAPGRIDPPFEMSIRVEHQGETYESERRGVILSPDTIRLLTPEPIPVIVPRARSSIVIDGRLDDWKSIPLIRVPLTGAESVAVRLAWRAEGLYLAADIADERVSAVPGKVWENDGLELFVEADSARSFDARKNPHALKSSISPLSVPGGGAHATVDYGPFVERPEIIRTAWRKTTEGYTLELLVPREVLLPAAMSPGTRMGFHYVLWNDGVPVEQFVDHTGKDGVWRTPLYWGAVQLAPFK